MPVVIGCSGGNLKRRWIGGDGELSSFENRGGGRAMLEISGG